MVQSMTWARKQGIAHAQTNTIGQITQRNGESGNCDEFDFVDSPPGDLMCSICLSILRDPTLTSCCGNHFCQGCIEKIRGNSKPCPLCQSQTYTTMVDKSVKRRIGELKVKCPRSRHGCTWIGRLNDVLNHTSRACDFTDIWGRVKKEFEIRDEQMAKIHRDIDHLLQAKDKKVDELQAVIVTQQQEIKKLKVTLCNTMKDEKVDDLQAIVRAQQQEIKKLKVTLCNTTKDEKVDDLQAIVRTQQQEIDKLRAKLQDTTKTVHLHSLPPIEFVMSDFDYHYIARDKWFSAPFYSHEEGYKMCLSVIAYGVGRGAGNHVSIFANVMRGEFDDQFEWPFRGHVKVDVFVHMDDREVLLLVPQRITCEFTDWSPVKATRGVVQGERNNYGQGCVKCIAHADCDPDFIRLRVDCVVIDED